MTCLCRPRPDYFRARFYSAVSGGHMQKTKQPQPEGCGCYGNADYFGSKSVTSDFSSFNSFSVAAIFVLLKSLSGTF